ncbi:hypothetical protein KAFR_0G00170 [Kazachstania africana CBS 2517]|uniref:Glycoside hydrolase family 5 domain-containing protein n=1 Tax=Kazachstania africana (strain ATCC 22294 / BCRC 22015 / CBS 2517 / CECT 1963 / NBRC 1671 / NRRL Y-8276) TaxID=1071382 RepID=H2AXF0_KAZAF|nr:hypothetical protein KAFR_0G00170 [Kazachstania africana CBS 2517]CCF59050.1 hypothetical protein KAFR_0G00170 [Kazachstania africana CBS 2517]
MPSKLTVSANGDFTDEAGNVIVLRGVNFDPSIKNPTKPVDSTHVPADNVFYESHASVSFVGHPIPLDQVEVHVSHFKSLGYNCIRFPFTWEALEHEGPHKYDYEYMDYCIDVLKKIMELDGIYVYLDPHQDVWSRYCGGSGSPYWSLLAAGFQPTRFKDTHAALLQGYHMDPITGKESIKEPYPKMVWATNYYKLAAQTMFTLFFAGKQFAPKCVINGLNIEDYLQECYMDAIMTFYKRIQERAPELFTSNTVIGLESMNEPNEGYIGETNLGAIGKERTFNVGLTPTGFQSLIMGEGFDTIIDVYESSVSGPHKVGTKNFKCNGKKAWLSSEERDVVDAKYGWTRNPDWKAGECIWKQHDVWEVGTDGRPNLLIPDYFSKSTSPGERIDIVYFINTQFINYYKRLYHKFRAIDSEHFIIAQPTVYQVPPKLTDYGVLDNKTICASHFYDFVSWVMKTWNTEFNFDTIKQVRNECTHPKDVLVEGEDAIRNVFREQLKRMKDEITDIVGNNIPLIFTEIGMPLDMEDKKAYRNGDYSTQTKAIDALHYALESNNLSYSFWCYCSVNSHEWGDDWNNEDFSIWSPDDIKFPVKPLPDISLERIDSSIQTKSLISDFAVSPVMKKEKVNLSGYRAIDALVRPFPIKISGFFSHAAFDLPSRAYSLSVIGKEADSSTYIYLPSYHLPIDKVTVDISTGKLEFDPEYDILKWEHGAGEQTLNVMGNY